MTKKKKVLAMALAAVAVGFGFQSSDVAEAASQTTSYHSPSPLRAQREAAEKHYQEEQEKPKVEAKAPAYQMVDVEEEETPQNSVFPTDGSYHSPSPLRAQRELAEKHAAEHKEVMARTPDGKQHRVLASINKEAKEASNAYDRTFVYGKAAVLNNGMHSYRKLHATVHVEDSIDEKGNPGTFVSVSRDDVRRWSKSSVSEAPILEVKKEHYFFPDEQAKDFDISKIKSLKPIIVLGEGATKAATKGELEDAED